MNVYQAAFRRHSAQVKAGPAHLRRAWRALGLLTHLGIGLGLAWMLDALCRREWRGMADVQAAMGWWCRRALRIMGVRLDVTGMPLSQTHLRVANHISYLDILCLAAVAPGRFIAKLEIAGWPVFAYLARVTGTLFVARERLQDSLTSIALMSRALEDGQSLSLFPEGTTTDGSTVLSFHAMFFEAAVRARCPVQAVALSYPVGNAHHGNVPFIGDDALLSHLWTLLKEKEIVARIHFLEPLPPSSRRDLAERARQQISDALSRAERPLARRPAAKTGR